MWGCRSWRECRASGVGGGIMCWAELVVVSCFMKFTRVKLCVGRDRVLDAPVTSLASEFCCSFNEDS